MSFSETFTRLKNFLTHGVWRVGTSDRSWKKTLRVVLLTYKGFLQDDLTVHASALTYGTLTALVPVLAVAVSVMRGFGMGDEFLTGALKEAWFLDLPEGMQEFIRQLIRIVTETNFAALGWIALGAFIVTAVCLLMNIERGFNRIWGVHQERDLVKQVPIYTTLLVVVPLLIGVVVAVRAKLYFASFQFHAADFGLDASTWGQNLFTFAVLLVAMFAMFVLVPNTRVEIGPAAICSAVTTLVLGGWMKVFAVLQIGVARYNYIYGAVAALPIFLFWLYIMWVLLLLGVELNFAMQNQATYEQERAASGASPADRLAVALALLAEGGRKQRERGALDLNEFVNARRVPFRLVSEVAESLVARNYLAKAGGWTLTLKGLPSEMPLSDVVQDVFSKAGDRTIATALVVRLPELKSAFEDILQALEGGLKGRTLADLL